MCQPCNWNEWSEIAKVVLLVAGVAFLVVKAVFGYFMINLSIEPSVQRYRGRNGRPDDLLLTLKLNKGDREAATLYKIVITPTRLREDNIVEPYATQEHEINNPTRKRHIRLSPGETTTHSYHINVPSDAICKFNIEVFGGSGFLGRPRCYWTVSAMSLPSQAVPAS